MVHLAHGQGSVLVFVEAEVLRRLTESAITSYNHHVGELTPRALQMFRPRNGGIREGQDGVGRAFGVRVRRVRELELRGVGDDQDNQNSTVRIT